MSDPLDFPRFFEAVYGYPPFPWQAALADKVCREGWSVDALALPTAAGKTAVLDIAVFHLAVEADRPLAERRAPMRIWFVIDRRIVVDEVTQRAKTLAKALASALSSTEAKDQPIRAVAAKLQALSDEHPLAVVAFRGGIEIDRRWALSLHQPLVGVSTIDQLGSRMLFRGYGVSPRQWPVQAALCGEDSLIIADEAHLSGAFIETMRSVISRYRGWAEQPLRTPSALVEMTATPKQGGAVFELTPADRDPVLAPKLCARLKTSKPVDLDAPDAGFEAAVVKHAVKLAKQPGARVIGVVLNRVQSARIVFDELNKRDCDALLLTGRSREADRRENFAYYLPFIEAKENRPTRDKTLYVVATQTIEVGANVDFDALVTEAAPLDALRQRFGRLNRLGADRVASGAIVLRPLKAGQHDLVYETASDTPLSSTWKWLKSEHARAPLDFGIDALSSRLPANVADLLSRSPEAPPLLPAYINLWCQTSPTPHPDPDVAPFLHGGNQENSTDVRLVWRCDIPDGEDCARVQQSLDLFPLQKAEGLPVPLYAVRAWLTSDPASTAVADIEGLSIPDERKGAFGKLSHKVFRWTGDEFRRLEKVSDLRPGDTLVIPSTAGGADLHGWSAAEKTPVVDLAEAGDPRWLRLRLSAPVLRNWLQSSPEAPKTLPEGLSKLLGTLMAAETNDDVVAAADLLLTAILSTEKLFDPRYLERVRKVKALENDKWFVERVDAADGERVELVVLRSRLPLSPEQLDELNEEESAWSAEPDDQERPTDTASGESATLSGHTREVIEEITKTSKRLGLSPVLHETLVTAAELHDIGKLDPRFQSWLHNGDEGSALLAIDELRPLAKSIGNISPAKRRETRIRAGYPSAYRHELLSVSMIDAIPSFTRKLGPNIDRDLIRHLIGTHHGWARPWAPIPGDSADNDFTVRIAEASTRVSFAYGYGNIESDWPDLFCRLIQRYSAWGLAYLEACLRTADASVSAHALRP